jgi:hypothetical protein
MALDRRARPAPEDTSAIMDLARRQPECGTSVGPLAGTSASDELNGVRIDIAALIDPDGSFRSIVANDVSGDVMGGDANAVHLITGTDAESWDLMSKAEVARRLAQRIADALA